MNYSWTCLAVLLIAAGCGTTSLGPPGQDWSQAADSELRLQPGDLLRVRFAYWPELDDEQAIRPDGKIALQLVGDVVAKDLTPEQLRQQLLSAYASKLNNPEIAVIVRALDSRRVYIGGEVKTPGVIAMPGRLTLVQAIMQAGGFNKQSAKLSNVVVVRQQDGKQHACAVDVRKSLTNPMSDPFVLQPLDMVYVPRTAIDRVDQWVDQYINQIIPRNVHASFSVNRDIIDSDTQTQQSPIQIQTTIP